MRAWQKPIIYPTVAALSSEGEAVVRSPRNMAAAKIAAVDFRLTLNIL